MWPATKVLTLQQHLKDIAIDKGLANIIINISEASKYIRTALNNPDRFCSTGQQNIHGDRISYLDRKADEILLAYCKKSREVWQYCSEEREDLVQVGNTGYCVATDPIDGSSLVEANLTIGTIASIYMGEFDGLMIAALYILYGPLTTLVCSTAGNGTHEFVLDKSNQFVLSRQNIKLKNQGRIYGTASYNPRRETQHHRLVRKLMAEGYRNRYSGCFVADANHILMKGGGLFCYPKTAKYPNGKLRKLFELDSLAFIFKEAGGMATDGTTDILQLTAEYDLATTLPVYIGSRTEVRLARLYLANESK